MIWTNVARTNVTVTTEICSRYLLLKFGQNWVSNSGDIRWGFLLVLLHGKAKLTPSSTGTELKSGSELGINARLWSRDHKDKYLLNFLKHIIGPGI